MKKPGDWQEQKRILENAGRKNTGDEEREDFKVVVAWNGARTYTASLNLSRTTSCPLATAKGRSGPQALSRLFDAAFNAKHLEVHGGKTLVFDVDRENLKISRPPHPGIAILRQEGKLAL